MPPRSAALPLPAWPDCHASTQEGSARQQEEHGESTCPLGVASAPWARARPAPALSASLGQCTTGVEAARDGAAVMWPTAIQQGPQRDPGLLATNMTRPDGCGPHDRDAAPVHKAEPSVRWAQRASQAVGGRISDIHRPPRRPTSYIRGPYAGTASNSSMLPCSPTPRSFRSTGAVGASIRKPENQQAERRRYGKPSIWNREDVPQPWCGPTAPTLSLSASVGVDNVAWKSAELSKLKIMKPLGGGAHDASSCD
jgi:hypothetical protein